MSTDIALTGASELALSGEQTAWTDKQRYALRLGANATAADLAIYFHVVRRTGLDPFARQIYMIERNTKRGPQQTIQTGIDGYRLIARRAAGVEGYGYEDTLWADADGVWHDVWVSSGQPTAAKVTVVHHGHRYSAVAHMAEYRQAGDMWTRMPANQLAKCAEALALRRAFPQDLSGLYVDAEIGRVDVVQSTVESPAPPRVTAADFAEDEPEPEAQP